jgi:hypothetical protein
MKKSFKCLQNGLFVTVFLGILSISNLSYGQEAKERATNGGDFKSKLFFGGGLGLQFGSVTLIEISPLIGYKATPKFSVGISPTYKYYKYKDYYSNNSSSSTNVFGGSVFARYDLFQNVFAHVEYETLFYNTNVPGGITERQQFNSFLVGGGYQQPIGGNSGMYILVLWNLNDTPDSPYTNPIIRVGFNIGM